MIWILLGALILAGTFFVMALVQVLSIESRLRHLVVETEEWIASRYKVRLVPPGTPLPENEVGNAVGTEEGVE